MSRVTSVFSIAYALSVSTHLSSPAQVVLQERCDSRVIIQAHPVHDAVEHSCVDELSTSLSKHGVYGGHRLMLCTVQTFLDQVAARQAAGACPAERNGFCLSYDTTIPRQVW